ASVRFMHGRPVIALVGALLFTSTTVLPATAKGPSAATVGMWSAPFEEGGLSQHECQKVKGQLVCKPTAVTAMNLSDGRVLYWDGIEGSEKVTTNGLLEAGTIATDSRARLLDLRGGHLRFSKPT